MCNFLDDCDEVREHRHGGTLVPTAVFPDESQAHSLGDTFQPPKPCGHPYGKCVCIPTTTAGEVRVTSSTGGEKGQKQARLGSIDPQALLTMAEVAGFGEAKYARLNYMNGYPYSLSWDATQRHLLAFWSGQDLDDESGLPHLAHAAWHCLAMLAFLQHGIGEDDRFKRATDQEPGYAELAKLSGMPRRLDPLT